MISVLLDHVRLASLLNAREHHMARARRAQEQRGIARLALAPKLNPRPELPLEVTITRIAPGTLDTDNLAGSAKHVRDGIADALGVDDGDTRIEWRYAQEKAKRGTWGVRIDIAEARS